MKLAVFGNPIEHSLSPRIHTLFAQQTGVEIEYDKILAPVDGFAETAQNFINQGVKASMLLCHSKLTPLT
ncbi:Shikimate 5-dehydrogenase I alpha (EC [uncultured Gammaproteobacteria bacterium]|nr:Shikimate 5-dehydrogenase I alpha (EC [uncultured Gammaproteobacteria bacterium]